MSQGPDRIGLDKVPEKARHLLGIVEAYKREPLMAGHFHQVTSLSFNTSLGEKMDFYALEFRAGTSAALLWSDAQGNWRAGRWLTLPRPEADISAAAGFGIDYFRGVYTYASFTDALQFVTATKPAS